MTNLVRVDGKLMLNSRLQQAALGVMPGRKTMIAINYL